MAPAPEFDLENVRGGRLKSSDFEGKVLIVDFWATWCAPCKKEAPEYNALLKKVKDKGVDVLAVTYLSGDTNDVKPFLQEFGIEYPVAMGTDEFDSAMGGHLWLPTTFLVGKDRKIYRKIQGTVPGKIANLEADIDELLAKP